MADRKTHRSSYQSPRGSSGKTPDDPSSGPMWHFNMPRTQHSYASSRSRSPNNRKRLNDRARSTSPASQNFTSGFSSKGSCRSPRSYSEYRQAQSLSFFKMPDEKGHPCFTTANWRASINHANDGEPVATHEQNQNPHVASASPPKPPHQSPPGNNDNDADEREVVHDWNREAFEHNREAYYGHDERSNGRARKNSQLPKHFAKPLTCYYWAQGNCTKHEEDCWYAHWHTGVIADAPITVDRRSIAGRAAQDHLDAMDTHRSIARRELDLQNNTRDFRRDLNGLKQREHVVSYRERDIYQREAELEARLRNLVQEQANTQAKMDMAYNKAKYDMDQHINNMVAAFSKKNDDIVQELVSVKYSFQKVLVKVNDFYGRVSQYFLPLEGDVVLQKDTVDDLRAMAAQTSECMKAAEAALTKASIKIKEAEDKTADKPINESTGPSFDFNGNI